MSICIHVYDMHVYVFMYSMYLYMHIYMCILYRSYTYKKKQAFNSKDSLEVVTLICALVSKASGVCPGRYINKGDGIQFVDI